MTARPRNAASRRSTVRHAATSATFSSGWFVGLLGGIVTTLVIAARALLPTPIGRADDGGAIRYACQVGLVPAPGTGGARFFDTAILSWQLDEPGTSPSCPSTPSTMLWLLNALRWGASTLGSDTLDLRVLLLAYAVVAGVAVGFVMAFLRGSLRRRIITGALLTVVLADAAFVGYAGSLYAEAAAILGVILLAAGAFVFGLSGRHTWLGLAICVAGGVLAAGSRTSFAHAALPAVVFLAVVGWRHHRATPGARGVVQRLVPAVAALAIAVPAVGVVQGQPEDAVHVETWDVITSKVLVGDENPGPTLYGMGFRPAVADYAAQGGYASGSLRETDLWEEHAGVLRPATVWSHVLAHPGRGFTMLDGTARAYLDARPDDLGSYTSHAQMPPRAQETRFAIASAVSGWFAGAGLAAAALIWLAVAATALVRRRQTASGTGAHSAAGTALLLLACSIVSFAAVTFEVGSAVDRAIAPASLALMLSIVFAAASLPGRGLPSWRRAAALAARGRVAILGAGAALREHEEQSRQGAETSPPHAAPATATTSPSQVSDPQNAATR